MHPDVEIIVRQRKISATRTEPEPVRASRAQIERGMTNGMRQGARNRPKMAHPNGFPRPNHGWHQRARSRYGTSLRPQNAQVLDACDRQASAVVIAMATDGKTLHETAIKNLPSEPTIRRRWHRGLALYCEPNGLPRD